MEVELPSVRCMKYQRIRKSYRSKPKRQWWRNKFIWGVALSVCIAGVFSYNFLFSPFFQVRELRVSGNQKTASGELDKLIWSDLGREIFLFQSRSIFLASPDRIEQNVIQMFPRIATAELKRELPDILTATVKEREQVAIWCGEARCFLVDKEGVIFEESGKEGYFVLQNSGSGEDLRPGQKVILSEKLSRILEVKNRAAADAQLVVNEVFLASDKRINARTGEGWEFYINTSDDISWQMTRLKLVLAEEIPAEKRPGLEYIDLRFSKVYYKYR